MLVMLVRDPERWRPDPPDDGSRRRWDPNWRAWAWLLVGAAFIFLSRELAVHGGLAIVPLLVGFGCVCRGVAHALGDLTGLRDWRQ